MLFTADVTVTTDHTATNKKEQTLKIAHGIITFVSVLFPSGCHGLVHCAILHHEHQVFPSTENMSLKGDRIPIEWAEYYESYQPPYELKIKAWGVDCDYEHVVTVRVAILPRKAVVATSIFDAIKGIFGLLRPRIILPIGKKVEIEE